MVAFRTAAGPREVRNWGYQLEGREAGARSELLSAAALARAPHDLLVMDFSADGSDDACFSAADIGAICGRPGNGSVVVSYISIGEASDYRSHWQDDWTTWHKEDEKAKGKLTAAAPAWLGPWNPDWPQSRKVRYWDPGWQAIVSNDEGTGWLDRIVACGFDGAYLDIVDGYWFWGSEVRKADRRPGDPKSEKEAAQRMIDFIVGFAARARRRNPDFLIIPQNGAFIIDALEDEDDARKQAYLAAINAIAAEDVYFGGDKDENNKFRPDKDTVAVLKKDFLGNGKPVLVVDYLNQSDKVAQFFGRAVADGFLPYAAPSRDLDRLGAPYHGSAGLVA